MNIDTTNCNVSIWNVKLPKQLAEIINKLQRDTELGILKISQKEENGPIFFEIKLNDNLNLEMDLKVELKNFKGNSLVIRDLDNKPKIEGRLVKECFITPIINERYYKYIKQKKETIHERQVEWIDFENDFREDFEDHRLLETDHKRRREMLRDRRKERLGSEEVLNLIFSLFEKKDKWTIKDLSEKTGQPIAFITEILNDVAEKDEGSNIFYKLKEEFRY